MSNLQVVKFLRRYKKAGRTSAVRRAYLRLFEPKMLYRTTKTENPETTRRMVAKVIERLSQ